MILLTRLSGTEFALNCDLIERVEATPDTLITLVDGKKYLVTQTVRDVIDAVSDYHSAVLAGSVTMAEAGPGKRKRHLAATTLHEGHRDHAHAGEPVAARGLLPTVASSDPVSSEPRDASVVPLRSERANDFGKDVH